MSGRVLLALAVAALAAAGLSARGASPAAFGWRCIPPGCVAPRSNTPGILTRRALPKPDASLSPGRLGATPEFHHGLLGFDAPAAQARTGTIKGRISVSGKAPGNPVIRMGMDPMCARINAGKRVVDEVVVASADGSLANAFVKLEGSFPGTPVPTEPVTIDQRGCIYGPRVVGARVGQLLRVRNGDNLLHNVHSISTAANGFNVAQPIAGMQYDFRLKDQEILKLKCDVHRWMVAYVDVVSHPYFAVSGGDGSFTINGAPAGKQTLSAWHERFGVLKQTADVKPGATTTVTFTYTGGP